MTYDYDLIVIGAGGGGLTAAIGGASIGARVLLIEGEKLGGDCTHYGCVPSKALIYASKLAHAQTQRASVGLKPVSVVENSTRDVLAHVKRVVDDVENRFEDPEEIKKSGVDIEMGFATFTDAHTVTVNDKSISAKKFVIATGARPVELPIPGLQDVEPLTNRTVFEPRDLRSLLIIGSGPIGCELGQAFARLGVDVSIVTRDDLPLGRDDQKAGELVEASMKRDGVKFYYKKDIVKAQSCDGQKGLVVKELGSHDALEEEIWTDEILVAVGRAPNVENLGLETIGVQFDNRKGITVDEKTRTSVPHIYAVGDIATPWKFTHYANHMAKVALTNMIFHYPARISSVIPRATFVSPEVASIGVTTRDRDFDTSLHVFEKQYDHVDRAITDLSENGFFQIITDDKGMIKGATIVGGPAGEMINEMALAMEQGISITKLSDTIHAYPTYGYGLRNCADEFRAMGYTEGKKAWVKKIFNLRG